MGFIECSWSIQDLDTRRYKKEGSVFHLCRSRSTCILVKDGFFGIPINIKMISHMAQRKLRVTHCVSLPFAFLEATFNVFNVLIGFYIFSVSYFWSTANWCWTELFLPCRWNWWHYNKDSSCQNNTKSTSVKINQPLCMLSRNVSAVVLLNCRELSFAWEVQPNVQRKIKQCFSPEKVYHLNKQKRLADTCLWVFTWVATWAFTWDWWMVYQIHWGKKVTWCNVVWHWLATEQVFSLCCAYTKLSANRLLGFAIRFKVLWLWFSARFPCLSTCDAVAMD